MKNVLNLYLDDSGTRHPSHKIGNAPAHGYDWFALGGVLIEDDHESVARELHQRFVEKWNIVAPLHSSEIRSKNENFLWLRELSKDDQNQFYEELYLLMRESPLSGIACVVDRPGYNARYAEQYNQNPWLLCKTAFSVVVERAAKFARSRDCRLRVLHERCNKVEDRSVKRYYDDLKATGLPFDQSNSQKYEPLTASDFSHTLYELRAKAKSSPLMQLADLYLWPMCMGGYHKSNRPYRRLIDDGKLIECKLDQADHPQLGTKYSCFDNVTVKQ